MKEIKRMRNTSKRLQIFQSFQLAADHIARQVYSLLTRHKLTVSQFGVLQAIYREGPLHQIRLAEHIAKTTGNLTTVVDNLEKRDLVKRVREQKDRRYFKVELTPGGKKLIGKVYPAHVKRVQQVLEKLTDEEQEALKTLCAKLLAAGKDA